MITIEQAKALRYRDNILQVARKSKATDSYDSIESFNTLYEHVPLAVAITWRINGKVKLWKRDTSRFSIPIKHGLYDYGYLTNENAHLFDIATA